MKKVLKILIILFIVCFITLFGIKIYVNSYPNGNILNITDTGSIEKFDYIVIPGAKIKSENTMSLHLQHRLDCGIKLYNENISNKIIISGGIDKETGIHETLVMKNYLLDNNINENDIITDEYGLSTYDTLKRIYEYDKNSSYLICTQDMYTARTYFIAKNVGLNASVINSDIQDYPFNIMLEIREFLAPTKAFFNTHILKPKPAYTLKEKGFN